jgi:hypothetical protein
MGPRARAGGTTRSALDGRESPAKSHATATVVKATDRTRRPHNLGVDCLLRPGSDCPRRVNVLSVVFSSNLRLGAAQQPGTRTQMRPPWRAPHWQVTVGMRGAQPDAEGADPAARAAAPSPLCAQLRYALRCCDGRRGKRA